MILAFVSVVFLKVKEAKVDAPPSIGSSVGLLKEPIFAMAVLGIFLYVGAESCMGRFLKPVLHDLGLNKDDANMYGPTAFFLLLTIGRLLGGAVLAIMTPADLFSSFGPLGIARRSCSYGRLESPGLWRHCCGRPRLRQHLADAVLHHG